MMQAAAPAPDVSFILVCWNSSAYIDGCLESVFRQTKGCTFEVIAVDNGSADATAEDIARRFPDVLLIRAGANLGFARGVNLAARYASGRYVFLLNPDTRLESDVSGMVAVLDALEDAGAAGPRIVDDDGKACPFEVRRFPELTGTFFREFGLRKCFPNNKLFGRETLAGLRLEKVQAVPCLSGAALMARRELLPDGRLLDDTLPMYYEDIDLCARIRRAGRRLYHVPSVRIAHTGGASFDLSPQRSALYALENGQAPWQYFRSHRSRVSASTFTALVLLGSLVRLAVGSIMVMRGYGAAETRRMRDEARVLLGWSFRSKRRFRQKVAALFAEDSTPVVSCGPARS